MPFDLSYEYSVTVGILALLGLFASGFISGIFYWAAREEAEDRPPFLRKHALYFGLKIAEYTLMVVSLYFLFVSMGWITTAIAYILMEYRLHHMLKPFYKKRFGIPTEKASTPATA
ncbi:MAG: hypothetical protein OEV28_05845 [Nitrospirota bacterium]|nr:hypothetical protein [Nitrospirota bacterium]